jgi:hypothetical protein
MTSYIWRSSSTNSGIGSDKRGTMALAGTDKIQFDQVNVSNGKYIHQTQLDLIVGVGENEKPKGNVNEIQDTFLDSITWIITGSVVTETGNSSVLQLVKEWLIEAKTDTVFTKGRFGLTLDDVDAYNLVPTGTGTTPEQPKGYVLTNWRWVRDGETNGKAGFIATLRFNGDVGNTTTTPNFNWTVNHS